MAMQPYLKSYYTGSYLWGKYTGNSVQIRKFSERSLGDIYSTSGDYRTANRHSYMRTSWRGWIGTRKYIGNGELLDSTSGAQPYTYNAVSSFLVGYEPSALAMALSEAYDKLRGSVDLSVDLVQWRQTLQMISLYRRLVRGIAESAVRLLPQVDRIKTLQRDLTDAQRLGKRTRRLTRELNRAVNSLARARLEYTYGWSPTMGTLHDLCELAVTPPPGEGLLVAEGRGRVKRTMEKRAFSVSSKVPAIHTMVITDRAAVRLYFNPPVTVMSQLAQISSLNPVSLLYEVIPFSFVLDWAWDIGGWIRTLETAFVHRNDFVDGWEVLTQRTSIASRLKGVEYTYPSSPTTSPFTTWDMDGEYVRQLYNRKRYSSAPYPVNPVKQFTFGVNRQLNAIALAKVVLLDADQLIAGRRYH